MHLAEIWRYPVKSMAGERLPRVDIGPLGLHGDRVVHVEDSRGRVITARSHPGLLGHHATVGADGEPLVDGAPWSTERPRRTVEQIAGAGARLVRDDSADRFDILPLLVATDGAIAAFGYGGRRLRPNLVIGGVEGLEERTWEGRCLKIGGDVLVGIEDLRGRCVMTTFDPDTLEQDRNVLLSIVRRFAGKLALNAFVSRGGTVQEGDRVELLSAPACRDLRSALPLPAS
jgi:uncharacterized protein YcbX